MKYIKLNKNWNAEPNAPQPVVSESDGNIELTFFLNSFLFDHIDENEKGILSFSNVFAYKLGTTNDEGYLRGEFRFKNDQLPWGEFYELPNSNWKNDFPADQTVVNEELKGTKLRHFIFFLRDHVFECLASEFRFQFDPAFSEALEEKYPKGYLNHYLSMFANHFDKPSVDSYNVFTNLYIQLENKKEFEGLKAEIKNIKTNKDVDSFVKIAAYKGITGFGRKQLDEMLKVIETYNTGAKFV